jgi:hypothetical protein
LDTSIHTRWDLVDSVTAVVSLKGWRGCVFNCDTARWD